MLMDDLRKIYNKNCGPQTPEERVAYLAKRRAYNDQNRNEINQKNRDHKQNLTDEQKERVRLLERERFAKAPEKFRKKRRAWGKANPDEVRSYRRRWQKNRRAADPLERFKHHISNEIRKTIKAAGGRKSSRTAQILGIDFDGFKAHIESKWEPGMTWENWSLHGWHLDHIVPQSTAKSEDAVIGIWHYTNLQPLWAEDNIEKSNKLDWKKKDGNRFNSK